MFGANKTIEVVCHWDPALDMTESELVKYAGQEGGQRGTRDPALLRVKAGAKPTRYVIRPMSRAVMRMINSSAAVYARTELSFVYGVVAVLDLIEEDGTVTARVEPTGKTTVAGHEYTTWRTEDLERIPTWAVDEIGGVAYAHSDFPPGIARSYLLLRSSPLVAEVVQQHLADKIQRDAAANSSSRTEPQADAPSLRRQHAESGAGPIGVTATE